MVKDIIPRIYARLTNAIFLKCGLRETLKYRDDKMRLTSDNDQGLRYKQIFVTTDFKFFTVNSSFIYYCHPTIYVLYIRIALFCLCILQKKFTAAYNNCKECDAVYITR